ncbi:MAG TPA: hypothetical protein VK787_08730 [Puia sp.]|nr:hypothetical protein [Puia sp.]
MKAKKAKIFSSLIVIMATVTIFFACKKTSPDSGSSTPTVSSSVSGQITDLNNVPISNATVTAGTSTTSTDINGHFTVEKAELNKDAGFVQITKPGYFNGSRTFIVNVNSVNNVKIEMIPKVVSGNFATTSGNIVNVSGGGSVSFVANTMTNATTGAAYNGNVYVSTFYLNPADTNFSQYMPGDLRGISTNNQQNILKVFGMASVEMDDASGEKLQLATGKTATITLPIPSSLQAGAPATIPLWYFDETKGFWKQEGSATKQGANYVGSVAHFTFWAAGQLTSSVQLTAKFSDTSGKAFANKLITISSEDSTTTGDYTDSSGTVSGLVPANELLVMKAVGNCGQVVYTKIIGPFSKDTVLSDITISANNCGQNSSDTSQYINLTLFNYTYSWNYSRITELKADSSSYFTISILGGSPNDTGDSSTYFSGELTFISNAAPGNYTFFLYSIINGNLAYNTYYPNADPTSNVTQFDAVGGYIEGTASGWLKNFPVATTDSFPFTCSYRVKRVQ